MVNNIVKILGSIKYIIKTNVLASFLNVATRKIKMIYVVHITCQKDSYGLRTFRPVPTFFLVIWCQPIVLFSKSFCADHHSEEDTTLIHSINVTLPRLTFSLWLKSHNMKCTLLTKFQTCSKTFLEMCTLLYSRSPEHSSHLETQDPLNNSPSLPTQRVFGNHQYSFYLYSFDSYK